MIDNLTVLVLTFNEAPNIERTLRQLTWAKQTLIIDSFSTDGTVDLAKSLTPGAVILQRSFDTFAGQCNFGLSQITTGWVLSIDADYVLTPELVAEIAALEPTTDMAGYSTEFRYCIYGQPLRATVYPARTVLYRRSLACYRDEGHGHRVEVNGKIDRLSGKIDHDDRKAFSRWLAAQDAYSKIEAKHLLRLGKAETLKTDPPSRGLRRTGKLKSEGEGRELNVQDRLRLKIFFAAPVMFFYLLFGRGLILDGWPGWFYVAQRCIAELLLSMRLLIEREKLKD